jgi:hypothetical protein
MYIMRKSTEKNTTKKNTTKKKSPPQEEPPAKNKSEIKGVQGHGKVWENQIISVIVSPADHDESYNQPYTAMHDIPKHLNKQKPGTHVSIKATGTNKIDFGDARRTIHNLQNPDSPVEAIVVKYKQQGNQKIPENVMRIDLTNGKTELLGTMDEAELSAKIDQLDEMVKKGDPLYKETAKQLQKLMKDNGAALSVAPKIGNAAKKRSGRLQISLSNITKFAEQYPHLVIEDKTCKVYDQECLSIIESDRRVLAKKNKDESPH